MKKHFSFLGIATLIAMMALVGCPSDGGKNPDAGKITSLQSLIDNASAGDTINLKDYNISNYNATVNKALTINAADKNFDNANVTVTANGVVLNNIKNSNVTASASLGNGSLKIANSSLSKLTINGGGMHTIEIPNVAVNQVTINKEQTLLSENVRLLVDELTQIKNSLDVQSSLLIDWNGSVDPNTLFGDKGNEAIKLDKEDVNLAFRKSSIEMKTPDGKAKANFDTGDVDKSFYVFVNEGSKLNEAMVKQTANVICGNIDGIYQNNVLVDNFDTPLTAGTESNYTFGTTDKSYYIVYEYYPIIKKATDLGFTIQAQTLSANFNTRYFNQAVDMQGNIYYHYGATQLHQVTVTPNIVSEPLPINFEESDYTRLDIFDNGRQKLFARIAIEKGDSGKKSSLQILKNNEVIDSQPLVENVSTTDISGQNTQNVSFAQAVAFDNNGNIYVALCDCSTTKTEIPNINAPSYSYDITDKNSRIVKYSFTYTPASGDNPAHWEISEKGEDIISYKQLGIAFDINRNDLTIDNSYTDYTIILDTLRGIQDMKIVDNELVICSTDAYYFIDPDYIRPYETDKNQVIIYNLDTKLLNSYNIYDGESLMGPFNVAYADKNIIIILDGPNNKRELTLIKNNNKWEWREQLGTSDPPSD